MRLLHSSISASLRRVAMTVGASALLCASAACTSEAEVQQRVDSLATDYKSALEAEVESGWSRLARAVTQLVLFELVRESPCESLALQLQSQLTDTQIRAILVELQRAGDYQKHAAVWYEGGNRRYACGAAIRLPENLNATTKTAGGEFGVSGGGSETKGRLTMFYSTADLDARVARLREHHGLK